MQRFEQLPQPLDKWKVWFRWIFFLVFVVYFLTVLFWDYQNKLKQVMDSFMCVFFIVTFYPPNRKEASVFVEISNEQVHWNAFSGLAKDAPPSELLQWKEITMIKLLKENELMFFVENDFYHRLPTKKFTHEQQKEMIGLIRDYAAGFSIRWVDLTAKVA
ncbi:MAG: hypothetical protein ACOVNX_06295 [Sediminibacterium sp.]